MTPIPSKPVSRPYLVLLLGPPKLKMNRGDVLEPFFGIWLPEPRRKAIEGELRERLAAFGVQLSSRG